MKLLVVTLVVSFGLNAAWAQSSSVSASPTGAGAIAAPVSVAQPTAKKKWSGSAYVGTYASIRSINEGDTINNSSTDYYLEAKRDIGNGQSLGLRVSAVRYSTQDENNDKFLVSDPQIMYRNKIMASTVRLSMPVHEWSREIGRHELRYNGGMDLYESGQLTTSLLLEGRTYAYTKNEDGQLKLRGRNGVGFTYKVNDRFEPFVNALYHTRWFNDGKGNGITTMNTKTDPNNLSRGHWLDVGATTTLASKLKLYTYLTQSRAYDANTEILDKLDTAYNVELMASF